MSADSMYFSHIPLWAGVFSLLHTTTARPTSSDISQQSTQPTTSPSQIPQSKNGQPTQGTPETSEPGKIDVLEGRLVNTVSNGTDTQTFLNTTTTNASISSNDTIKVGNYNVAFCDNNLTTIVREDLQMLWENLQAIEQTTAAGTSNAAFKAFFKSDQWERFIEQMFSNITNGVALPKPESASPQGPTIACLTGPGEATQDSTAGTSDLYGMCSRNPTFAAFYRGQSSWIFLCPKFFQFPQQTAQPASQYCPNVIDNYFVQAYWENLVQNQMFILMHEILHYYIDSSPFPANDSLMEVTDINVAFNLADLDAVSNPQSYVIYDAMVSANCTNYPAPTDNDPDECSGECLTKLGSPAADVISNSTVTIAGMNTDTMIFGSDNTTYQPIGGVAQTA